MRPVAALAFFALTVAAAALITNACGDDASTSPTPSPEPTATAPALTATPAAPTPPPTTTPVPDRTPSPGPEPPVPSPSPATVVYRADTTRRAIALTFDAGSDPGFTADILRTLRDRNLRATFSLTGLWAEQNRDLLFAIAADGHQIINHSYDHPSFTGLSTGDPPLTYDERALQLSRTERTIYRYTSRTTKPYFRPPYGDLDDNVRRDVAAEGYTTIVMWTIDTLGWNGATADQILARVRDNAVPGAIVVMHVGSASQDAAALPAVIAALHSAGYELLTIDELLASP